jgi:hypothetical protein
MNQPQSLGPSSRRMRARLRATHWAICLSQYIRQYGSPFSSDVRWGASGDDQDEGESDDASGDAAAEAHAYDDEAADADAEARAEADADADASDDQADAVGAGGSASGSLNILGRMLKIW